MKKEKAKSIVQAYANLKNILSDKQYTQLKDIWKEKMRKKMKGMMEHMEGYGEKKGKEYKMKGRGYHMRGMDRWFIPDSDEAHVCRIFCVRAFFYPAAENTTGWPVGRYLINIV